MAATTSMMRRITRLVLATLAALLLLIAGWANIASGAANPLASATTWLAFPGDLSQQSLELFVTADRDTTGRVEIPGMAWQQAFTVTSGRVTTVTLPPSAQLTTNDGTQARGIHVVAADEVTVYGLNRVRYTTDAFLALPTDILGTEYLTLGYHNANIVNGSQFAVAAASAARTSCVVARGGSARAVARGFEEPRCLAWSVDGSSLYVSGRRGGDGGVWRIDVADGRLTLLLDEEPEWFAVSPDGRRLAALQVPDGNLADPARVLVVHDLPGSVGRRELR